MALKTVDMENCTPKRRCLSGANKGLAYTPGDECDAGYDFNPETCDCEAGWTSVSYKIQGPQTTYKYCCNSSPQDGCTGCTGTVVPGYPQTDGNTYTEESVSITREEWDARYSLGVDTQDPCNTFENFATLASTKTWRGPGIRWLGSSPDSFNGTCDPNATATAWFCVGRCDGNLTSSYIDGEEVLSFSYS